MTRQQRRMCAGKIRHRTAVEAGQHAEDVWQKYGDWMQPYPCRYCQGWHCGHGSKKGRR